MTTGARDYFLNTHRFAPGRRGGLPPGDLVVAFQKVQGLIRDGVAGQATWARLARPLVPAPRYRLATGSLEVDLAR
ncbi:MAG TPA: peptidoglycan-binding protein [Streptosporangiaceae bacterium]|nr:peptidoglycan-binding protein [Streptosporangiaceae bacterium]